jgi:hypothetical protein
VQCRANGPPDKIQWFNCRAARNREGGHGSRSHAWVAKSCVGHAWVLRGHEWVMPGSCVGHARVMRGSCVGHAWVVRGSCTGHACAMWGDPALLCTTHHLRPTPATWPEARGVKARSFGHTESIACGTPKGRSVEMKRNETHCCVGGGVRHLWDGASRASAVESCMAHHVPLL